ncbi:MAG: hypothetical protein WC381_08900 [Kiritimatiellia bacterium]
MAYKQCRFLLFVFVLAGRAALGASEAQERDIWTLWRMQTNEPAQHESIVAACRRIQQATPLNPLLPVAQGLAAWHSLRMGKTNDAVALFGEMEAAAAAATAAPAAPIAPTATAGAEMARRWLTRLDREQVRGALARYYSDAVEYPAALQALKKTAPGKKDAPLPWADRWGDPWQYQLAPLKIIKGAPGQRYVLQSKTLGESSDLAQALKRSYGGRTPLQPVSLTITSGGAQIVVFQTAGGRPDKIMLSEGGQAEGVTLTYIGAQILILCDGDHWRVVLKPAE